MAVESRLYLVKDGSAERLVEATNAPQALRFLARISYSISVASPKDVARLLNAGTRIEDATKADDAAKAGE